MQKLRIAIVGIWLALILTMISVSPALGEVLVKSLITGECDCDSLNKETTCIYQVYSGVPALSHIIMPVAPNCADHYEISSPAFDFDSVAQFYKDNFCGEVFGVKADQGLAEGQMTTITITYDQCYKMGIGLVYAALKGGNGCEIYPVPGVVDCEREPCVRVSMDATDADFRVRKPGDYAFRAFQMTINSNAPVAVSFQSFGDLAPEDPVPGQSPISAWYAIASEIFRAGPPDEFLTPAVFNGQTLMAPGDETDFTFSIWAKILSEQSTDACEYSNTGTITLILQNSETYYENEGGVGN